MIKLHERLKTKHHETFWIEVKNKIYDGKEYFCYSFIEHTKNPNVGQFDILLDQSMITLDLMLHRPSGHGDTYSFKIRKQAMPLLFPQSVIYDLSMNEADIPNLFEDNMSIVANTNKPGTPNVGSSKKLKK